MQSINSGSSVDDWYMMVIFNGVNFLKKKQVGVQQGSPQVILF